MTKVPDAVPLLSAGRHRSPRTGGCFMEIASFLAGERWSDHPKCTDPSLAELARCVNDILPDERRSDLALMIPSVIGTGHHRAAHDRAVLGATVVRSCTIRALPLVQLKAVPLACALILSERVLGTRTPEAEAALATQPAAAASAEAFAREHADTWRPTGAYASLAVPPAIKITVKAVSDKFGTAARPILIDMLAEAIAAVRDRCALEPQPYTPFQQRWYAARDLLGSAPPAD